MSVAAKTFVRCRSFIEQCECASELLDSNRDSLAIIASKNAIKLLSNINNEKKDENQSKYESLCDIFIQVVKIFGNGFDVFEFLSLLKLPIVDFGYARETYDNLIVDLENRVIRNIYSHHSPSEYARYARQMNLIHISEFVDEIDNVFEDIQNILHQRATYSFLDIAHMHIQCMGNILTEEMQHCSNFKIIKDILSNEDIIINTQYYSSTLEEVLNKNICSSEKFISPDNISSCEYDNVIYIDSNDLEKTIDQKYDEESKDLFIADILKKNMTFICGNDESNIIRDIKMRYEQEDIYICDVEYENNTQLQKNNFLPPAYNPEIDARPRSLSASALELLMRDPYSFYLKYALRIRQLNPLRQFPNASDFGNLLHKILYEIEDIDEFEDTLEKYFAEYKNCYFAPLWKKRMMCIRDFLKEMHTLFNAQSHIKKEVKLEKNCDMDGRIIRSYAICDRVEISSNAYNIIDYKTGNVPQISDVKSGKSPQLILENILCKENFKESKLQLMEYWHLQGNKCEKKTMNLSDDDISDVESLLFAKISELLCKKNAFCASYSEEHKINYNIYSHMKREQEWC